MEDLNSSVKAHIGPFEDRIKALEAADQAKEQEIRILKAAVSQLCKQIEHIQAAEKSSSGRPQTAAPKPSQPRPTTSAGDKPKPKPDEEAPKPTPKPTNTKTNPPKTGKDAPKEEKKTEEKKHEEPEDDLNLSVIDEKDPSNSEEATNKLIKLQESLTSSNTLLEEKKKALEEKEQFVNDNTPALEEKKKALSDATSEALGNITKLTLTQINEIKNLKKPSAALEQVVADLARILPKFAKQKKNDTEMTTLLLRENWSETVNTINTLARKDGFDKSHAEEIIKHINEADYTTKLEKAHAAAPHIGAFLKAVLVDSALVNVKTLATAYDELEAQVKEAKKVVTKNKKSTEKLEARVKKINELITKREEQKKGFEGATDDAGVL